MRVFVFPGQGSQYRGMGGTLFDEFPQLTETADEILGYSIKELCLRDPREQLTQTQFTQPAMYVVNALTYFHLLQSGRRPDFVAGHSLGEYNALLAAGAFDFATGLKLVKKRGELMAQATGGGMAAVIGLDEDRVRQILADRDLHTLDVANLNSPVQVIISGPVDDLVDARSHFTDAGARYVLLNVSGAFHSRYMADAARKFAEYVDQFAFGSLTIPVISNVHARPYQEGEVRDNLVRQLTSPVRWVDSIRYLMGQGAQEFEEVGPGDVLKGLIHVIREKCTPLVVPVAAVAAATMEQPVAAEPAPAGAVRPEALGDAAFRRDYGLKYAYYAGAMYKGISSVELVVKMGRAGLMGVLGTGGLRPERVEEDILRIQHALRGGEAYAVSLVCDPSHPETEERIVDLLLKHSVRTVEAGAFMTMTPALVRYRLSGLRRTAAGQVVAGNRIIAKLSRPEVAELFLSPAPERIVDRLVAEGKVTSEQAAMARLVPMADDLCAEADSGGHTDHGVAYALFPTIARMRDEAMARYGYPSRVRVGAAGGLGTPEAVAAAFLMGADFVVTGSVNQCTVEAGTSNVVKDMLQQMNIQDTEYVPAGDMFELGAKMQVLRKGVLFPARANKLYELYQRYNSLDEIDPATRRRLEEKYFRCTLDEVYREVKAYHPAGEIARAEQNPKPKMALVFRWYLAKGTAWALAGDPERKVDYQILCGPALGAFNQWVKGTPLEDWRNRHVDDIAVRLMTGAAEVLTRRLQELASRGQS